MKTEFFTALQYCFSTLPVEKVDFFPIEHEPGARFFMVLSAFKTRIQVFAYPPVWIFSTTFENLKTVVFKYDLTFYVKNAIIIAACNTVLTLLIALPAAYSFTRFRFKFKEGLFLLFIILQLVPGISVIIGFYYIATSLGLFDTHLLLIVMYLLWNIPYAIWMLRGFFEGIPVEVEEAAQVDGYSRLGAFFRVTLPLASPGAGAVALLLFILSWNEFTLPYFLTSFNARPLSTTVAFYTTYTEIMWGGDLHSGLYSDAAYDSFRLAD